MPAILVGVAIFAAGYACAKIAPAGLVRSVVSAGSQAVGKAKSFASEIVEDAEDAKAEAAVAAKSGKKA